MNNIEKNLYEFYRCFAFAKKDSYALNDGFEVLGINTKCWPQMIFNLNQSEEPEKLIVQITSGIENNKYPKYFLAPENYISKNQTQLLQANSIVPVKILMGMNMNSGLSREVRIPEKLKIQDLENKNQIDVFSQLVQEEFIAPEMTFEKNNFVEISKRKEITITGLFKDNILVSSMLVLTKENCAGLYFIVTKKQFQKKGYATILINFILNRLCKNGVKEVVLHANHNSHKLYSKLGFIDQNRFIIYRKLEDG